MGWQFTVWIPPLFIAGTVTLLIAVRAAVSYRRYPDKTYLLAFALNMAAITVWEYAVVVIEASTSLATKLVGYNLLGAIVVPVVLYSLFWFALTYTGSDDLISKRVAGIVPVHLIVATIAVVYSPELFYDVHLDVVSQPILFGTTPGSRVSIVRDMKPTFVGFQLYAYTILIATAVVLGRFLLRQHDRIYWGQALALGGAISFPLVANALMFVGVLPSEYHVTELSLLATGLLIAFAVFRYRLLDLVPVARATVIDEMRDGFVVCNEQHVVVDHNPRAGHLLGLTGGSITGHRLPSLVPSVEPLFDESNGTTETEFETALDGDPVYLRASASQIGGGGRLVSFHDITERRAYERNLEEQNEKLELLNRIVRHDISNDVMAIAGNLQLLEDHVDADGREHLEMVRNRTDNINELTSVLGEVMTVMVEDGDRLEPTPLEPILAAAVGTTSSAYDEAIVTVEGSVPAVSVTANETLASVFDNLLQNAVKHNDKARPEVTVGVERRDETVAVSVADNGPGIPTAQRDTIFGQGEKGLDSSGTGIGLYLVDTLVGDFGGEISVSDNEPAGTIFEVELPIAD